MNPIIGLLEQYQFEENNGRRIRILIHTELSEDLLNQLPNTIRKTYDTLPSIAFIIDTMNRPQLQIINGNIRFEANFNGISVTITFPATNVHLIVDEMAQLQFIIGKLPGYQTLENLPLESAKPIRKKNHLTRIK